jgi:Copper type II ascorbate-dependent monooxygenase, N-terminal domain
VPRFCFCVCHNGARVSLIVDDGLETGEILMAVFKMHSLFTRWAKGATPLILPDVAGFPVSDEERYFILQVHYDNPKRKEGVVDSTSGVLLHTTDTPRKLDAGTSEFLRRRLKFNFRNNDVPRSFL